MLYEVGASILTDVSEVGASIFSLGIKHIFLQCQKGSSTALKVASRQISVMGPQ